MKALIYGFRHYAQFSGTTPRRDFWEFIVLTHLVLILLLLPAWWLFLQLFNDIISDPRILDLLFAMAQTTPDEAYSIAGNELASALADICLPFAEHLVADYPYIVASTIAALLWGLCLIIPTLAITARRLTDAGHSRWWILPPCLLCIPLPVIADLGFIGSIVTLIFCCQNSRAADTLPPVPTPPAQ